MIAFMGAWIDGKRSWNQEKAPGWPLRVGVYVLSDGGGASGNDKASKGDSESSSGWSSGDGSGARGVN